MTLSVDSSCTQSACLTRSARTKRNSGSVLFESKDVRKKRRSTSPLSETSPQRPRLCSTTELRLSQESAKTKTALCFQSSTPGIVANAADISADLNKSHCEDDFLGSARLWNGNRGMNAAEAIPVKSMILHSQQLAHAILAAYEKERERVVLQNSEVAAELTRMTQCSNAAAKEIEKLRSMNAELWRNEAAATAQLQELQKNRVQREGALIAAALAVSKALMLAEENAKKSFANIKIARLRSENQKLVKERDDVDRLHKSELETLQATNEEINRALCEAKAERTKLMKELEETKTTSSLVAQDLLFQVATAISEVENLRLKLGILTTERNEVDVEKRKAQERVLELGKELVQRDAQAAEVQIQLLSAVEKCTRLEAEQLDLLLEEENFSQKVRESEDLAKVEVERLMARNQGLVQELENVNATLNRTRAQCSELGGIVYHLRDLQTDKGAETANLRTELVQRDAELAAAREKLAHVILKKGEADLRAAAEVRKLTKEKAESQAREEAALLKLHSMSLAHPPHSNMHLAFLINCGMLQSDVLNQDLQFSKMPQSMPYSS